MIDWLDRGEGLRRPPVGAVAQGRSTSPARRAIVTGMTVFWGLAPLMASTEPLLADPLKATMAEMARTTKEAKAALSVTDPATFDAILKAYAGEGRAGMALFPGGSAKGQDLRTRFSKFAATADAARQPSTTPARFRAAFGSLVSECRSCHSAYK